MTAGELVLGRVRIESEALDPGASRARLSQMLASSSLRPTSLAPSAMLYIRRLADPRPGTLRLDSGGERPPPEWERAFLAALERSMTAAARPAREAVAAAAEAVLFADRAELLACLARDASDGSAHTKWWWRTMLRSGAGAREAAIAAWIADPEHAPAAMELLASQDETVALAGIIPTATAWQLTIRVAVTFAAPALHTVLIWPSRSGARATGVPAGSSAGPPWRGIVPEASAASLNTSQALLLGVLLGLRRAPVLTRSASFAAETERWLAAVGGFGAPAPSMPAAPMTPTSSIPARETTARESSRPAVYQPAVVPPLAVDVASTKHPAACAAPARRSAPPRPPRAAVTVHDAPRESASTEAPGPATPSSPPAARIEPASPRDGPLKDHVDQRDDGATERAAPLFPDASVVRAQAARPASPSADIGVAPAPPEPPVVSRRAVASTRAREPEPGETAIRVDTGLGGLFYLLNLALQLDLYSDFTRPLDPGITLDPWDFTYLLGTALLGRREPDPVWGLLAELAGRLPDDAPGRGFSPPRAWRVPSGWLEPFDHAGVWHWSAAGGLLRLIHPAGFPVTVVPRTSSSPAEQLRQELRRLRPIRPDRAPVRATLSREPGRPLARWIARLCSYSEARLRVVLGLAPEERVADVLLAHRARVLVSPSHVDVVLSLEHLPIAIRLAGLDRDPGWIPAAGRHLAFHFE